MPIEAQIPIPVVIKDTPTSKLTEQGASGQEVWAAALAAAIEGGGAIVRINDVSATAKGGVVVTPLPKG